MSHLQHTALATQALDLPASERAQLALLLFDSVEGDGANLWPGALVDELRRRAEELRSGKVKGLTSEEVFGESL
ncbi:MAG: addiction module protein [Opitutaceae bacterium]|nr:addiction module protein [Opitutaceae bacterium]